MIIIYFILAVYSVLILITVVGSILDKNSNLLEDFKFFIKWSFNLKSDRTNESIKDAIERIDTDAKYGNTLKASMYVMVLILLIILYPIFEAKDRIFESGL